MRKRITSLLLTLAMLLSLLPAMGVTASAAETWETITTYEQFAAAMTANGQRNVRLGADIDTGTLTSGIGLLDTLTVKGQKQLDLNGHTLRLFTQKDALGNLIKIENSSLTLSDSSEAHTGRILGVTSTDSNVLISVWQKGKFTMNGGKLEVEAGKFRDVLWRRTIDCRYGGEAVINGGTLYVPPETYERYKNQLLDQFLDEFDDLRNGSCGYTLIADNECKVTITGGTFQGPVRMNASNSKWNGTTSRVIINGGTFENNVVLNGAGSNAGDGKVTLAEIKGGTFLGKVQAWAAASFDSSFSTPEVVISGGDFSKEFWLRPKFPLVNDKEQEGMAYQVAAKLDGGTFHEGFSADKDSKNYVYSGAAVKQRLKAYEIYQLADKLLGQSAIQTGNGTFAAQDNNSYNKYFTNYRKSEHDSGGYAFIIKAVNGQPTTIIPNAWGMKSVTLDGNPIDYFKDWQGTVERMDNSTAHTLKFEWKPLAKELKDAGYTYRTTCEHYISGSTAVQQTDNIAADKTSHTITIPAGAEPKVYSFDLKLNLEKNGNLVGIVHNQHIVKLVVSEAPPAPPAPVAHSITITNTHGTANPATAIAGETVTVKADDRTSYSQMFTQWYTKTAGVTFADVTKQETTFVMPDRDVQVYPGYHEVSFTNQPTDSWLSSVDDSKVYFAFSQPITSWKLVNEDDTTLASGDAESANALVEATLGPKPDKTEMTCRVIVTSNGQNFTSNEFTLKWYNVPGAPDVTVYPEGGKFVETLDVNLETPNTYWGILYTTDGSDPYDKSGETWIKSPKAIEENDSTRVTINKDTTIKACLYNSEGYSNMEKFGDIVTCDFTKVELTPPVADPPSGTSFYDSLNVSLSTDIVNATIMWSDADLDVDALGRPGMWKEYEPEKESITLSGSYGMHGFYALTGIRMEHPNGYTYWVHSDKQDYSYPRITYATIADASVTGKVNEEITPVDVSITLSGDVFAEDLTAGANVSDWFTNLPIGLKATVKEKTNYTKTLVITISGTPKAVSAAAISVEMPKSALRYTGTGDAVEQTVLSNPKAVYNIGTDAVHTHDYTGQPYLYLDPGNHYQECTANDGGYNIQAHAFTPWKDNGNDTHSRYCTVCKMTDSSTYTETANHNWQWKADTAATPNAPGKQHEECVDCGAVKAGSETVIPMLTSIMVEHLTVVKPVKDAAAAAASTTDSAYTVAYTEWMSADGASLVIGDKFQPGTVYTAKITLETAGAGVFSAKSTYNPIEGKAATATPVLTGDAHADSVILTYTFDATEGSTSGSTGGGSGGGGVTTYAIAVKDSKNGDVTANHKSAAKGTTVTLTVDPDKGYVLDTLTVLDDKDKEIKLTEKNGKYVFTMPSGKVTVAGRFKVEQPAGKHPFTDIPSGAYYENAVIWAADKGITGGTSATTFSPNGICTRAQAVTFLWRAAGSPAPKSMNSFADVPTDAYYAKAVAWAVENGITSGTGGGKFSPNATCTRAQIVTFLYRAAGSPAVSGGSVFSDVKAGAYYADAVTWAANKGITSGIGNGLFGSDNNCTRAQIVTFLYQYVE